MILKVVTTIANKLKIAFRDLLPIIVVVSFFQIVVLQQSFPNLPEILTGLFFVTLGLMLFVEGLKIGLFPIGENLSYALVKKGSLFWLLIFSFLLAFSTTIAEPALIAVAKEAAAIAVEAELVPPDIEGSYAIGLRLSVAFSVGLAILIGMWRIIKGWPIYYLIIGGFRRGFGFCNRRQKSAVRGRTTISLCNDALNSPREFLYRRGVNVLRSFIQDMDTRGLRGNQRAVADVKRFLGIKKK